MDWKRIDSRQNPVLKQVVSLRDKKVRDKEQILIAEGTTLFFDFCSFGLYPEKVFLSEKALHLKEQIDQVLGEKNTECFVLSASAFEKATEEKGSQGLISLFSLKKLHALSSLEKPKRLLALEQVQDPGNVGTVIRSAAALGFDGVLTVGGADPFGSKAVRASMGAICRIPIRSFATIEALFDFLNENHCMTIAACLSPEAVLLPDLKPSLPLCVLIGNEGKGLSQEAIRLSDCQCMIPIEKVESLNAAAAATVFLWEMRKAGDRR